MFKLIWILYLKLVEYVLKLLEFLNHTVPLFSNIASPFRLLLNFFGKFFNHKIKVLNLWLHLRKFGFYRFSARLQHSNVTAILA